MHAAQAILIYCTVGSLEEGRRIGRILVEQRLAACVNLLPQMESIYLWKGAVATDQEAVLLAKTRPDLEDAARSCIVEAHSYECPCVVALPIIAGHPRFLHWIDTETTQDISDEEG